MEYVVIGVLLLVAIYFLFLRKSGGDQPQARPSERAPGAPSSRKKSEPPPPPKRGGAEVLTAESVRPAAAPSTRPQASVAPHGAVSAPPPGERQLAVQTLRRGLAKSRSDEGFFGRLRTLLGGK
jgi:hypothetical protein